MPAVSITVIGNLTADPEIRYGASGGAWISFTVANTEWRKNGDTWEDNGTSFYDVKAFGQIAENMAESFNKGDNVIVVGRMRQESWEDKKTGDKRSKMAITADAVGPNVAKCTVELQRVERYSSSDEDAF